MGFAAPRPVVLFPVVTLTLAVLAVQLVDHRRIRAAGPMSAADRVAIAAGWRTGLLPADVRQAHALLKLSGVKPRVTSYWWILVAVCEGAACVGISAVGTTDAVGIVVSVVNGVLWLLAIWTIWHREARSRPLRDQARERWIRGYVPGIPSGPRAVPPGGWPMLAPGADPWAPPPVS